MGFFNHSLTLCQQGGIGYPPSVIRLEKPYKGKRVFAIEDSREKRMPEILRSYLKNALMFGSPYHHTKNKEFRDQGWVWRWWIEAPRITWDKLIEIMRNQNEPIKN